MQGLYDVNGLTINDVKEMIANGDDNQNSQIRVTKDGKVFIHYATSFSDDAPNIKFRLEMFPANGGYLGTGAAEDENHIERLFNAIIDNWNIPEHIGYVDFY